MECPRCKGLTIIHVRAVPGVHQQYDVECPVCGGTGELPNSAELPKHCPRVANLSALGRRGAIAINQQSNLSRP
jgi:DnaJ-class molecular chaperone